MLEVGLERTDAGEFGMGPLFQQLAHHPALPPGHRPVGGIPAVPVRHREPPPGFQHPQQFIGVALLVGHVGAGFHTPHRIEAALVQFQGEGIHHGKAAMGQVGGGEGLRPGDLGRTDADPQHLQAVVAGQDPGTAADAAAHIQHPSPGGQLVEAAPVH